ncbi:MAG: 5'-methylthioadenosine/adenosylhomocysteine nucleosidase [Duodenibacillus sp.]|nr:5'-methylthioadenosine/adenosylhomocysteine nucleosidase [Duodenibacillus sp.]
MIGIIGAMEVEIAHLRDQMQDTRVETVSGIDFYCGRIRGREVVLAKCGIGKVFAALCAQTMILKFGVECIVNSGVAGTLTSELHIGDVAIATACVQHDMDTSPLGDPYGLLSGINVVELPADQTMVQALDRVCREAGVNHRLGPVATGDQFVHTMERRRWISDTFGAVAVEMEAGAIAHVCYVNRVPFAVIRVISDEASGEAQIDYASFVKKAAATSSDIALRWLAA